MSSLPSVSSLFPSLHPQLLWNYKLNLTTDSKFESVATEVCKSTIPEVSLGLHDDGGYWSPILDPLLLANDCEVVVLSLIWLLSSL